VTLRATRLWQAAALAACLLWTGAAVSAEGVSEPQGYRTEAYRAPVPDTLAGATVIDGARAAELWRSKGAIFVDVLPRPVRPANLPAETLWRPPPHRSIEGATWLANVGYGVLPPAMDAYFREGLEVLTERDPARPIVFFCQRDCWMSWNAAKRALGYGYRNVIWYPDGTEGFEEQGIPLVTVEPRPLPPP
jgi:PQQ-dependent catabolism-associated CXXCW motif protein